MYIIMGNILSSIPLIIIVDTISSSHCLIWITVLILLIASSLKCLNSPIVNSKEFSDWYLVQFARSSLIVVTLFIKESTNISLRSASLLSGKGCQRYFQQYYWWVSTMFLVLVSHPQSWTLSDKIDINHLVQHSAILVPFFFCTFARLRSVCICAIDILFMYFLSLFLNFIVEPRIFGP